MKTPIDRKMAAERIKLLRKEKDMTQTDLAIKLNVTRSRISSWETGRAVPDTADLQYMSKFFGVPIDYILGLNDRRYNINVPELFEFDLTKLNGLGRQIIQEFYNFLISSEKYTKD